MVCVTMGRKCWRYPSALGGLAQPLDRLRDVLDARELRRSWVSVLVGAHDGEDARRDGGMRGGGGEPVTRGGGRGPGAATRAGAPRVRAGGGAAAGAEW